MRCFASGDACVTAAIAASAKNPLGARHIGDARQPLQHGEVRERGVRRDRPSQLERACAAVAVRRRGIARSPARPRRPRRRPGR